MWKGINVDLRNCHLQNVAASELKTWDDTTHVGGDSHPFS